VVDRFPAVSTDPDNAAGLCVDVIFPQEYEFRRLLRDIVSNQHLLPIMYAEDYAKAGRKMLERYYKEALDKPTAIDGRELAKRMKLHVRKIRFEAGSDIRGRIYFDWTWVELKDENGIVREKRIVPMTVLINKDLCRTVEVENSTIYNGLQEIDHPFQNNREHGKINQKKHQVLICSAWSFLRTSAISSLCMPILLMCRIRRMSGWRPSPHFQSIRSFRRSSSCGD